MKNIIVILLLLSFSVSNAFEDNSKKGKKEPSRSEINSSNERFDIIHALDFSANTIFKNVTFNSVDRIDFINIYDVNQQQIFSASARIIVGDTLNISFLEKGTYYIEVIIGENIGAKQIII
ncbi:MAG: hypothetical protein KJN66_08250 [Bacteroidia bacterium]|nr:hypothetical protein [Bacteroidia bacterium]